MAKTTTNDVLLYGAGAAVVLWLLSGSKSGAVENAPYQPPSHRPDDPTGDEDAYPLTQRERIYGEFLASRLREAGYDPALGLALASHESTWRARAKNLAGSDGGRGGAWGLTQITDTTVRGVGFSGVRDDLLDPATHAFWMLKVLKEKTDRVGRDPADVFAAWNSGRSYSKLQSDLAKATPGSDVWQMLNTSLNSYVPKLLALHRSYSQRLYAGEFGGVGVS